MLVIYYLNACLRNEKKRWYLMDLNGKLNALKFIFFTINNYFLISGIWAY